MPTAADYAATASSVYDPAAASEKTLAGSALNSSTAGIDAAETKVKQDFASSADTLKTAHENNNAKIDFDATNALEGNASGLHTNATNIEGNNYIKGLTGLSQTENNNISAEEATRQSAISGYNSTLAAITQKYSGLKSGFVADMLNKDADRAFTERMANAANAANVSAAQAYAGGGKAAQPDPGAALNTDIFNSLNNFMVRPKGYSENVILPALMKQYGGNFSPDDIKKAFYTARKSLGYG